MSEHREPVETDEAKALSKRLRETREYLGLSQEYVAEQIGVQRATISAIETCRRKVNSTELKLFSRLYRRSPEYLLGQDPDAIDNKNPDEAVWALYQTTKDLSANDKQQVLRFAEFLRQAGSATGKSE